MNKFTYMFAKNILRKIRAFKNYTIGIFYLLIFNNLSLNRPFRLNGFPYFRISGKALIGKNSTFNSSTIYNTAGISKRCSIYVGPNSTLVIGENCGFSGVSIHSEIGIRIGDNCLVGANSNIWDTDFHSINYLKRRGSDVGDFLSAPINIGADVFIGANCLILKGVTIGDRSIIGAGSVVVKNVPPDQVWAGNPARFIKAL